QHPIVAVLTDPGGPVLPSTPPRSSTVTDWLRSSPTPEGRCCQLSRVDGVIHDRVAILTDPGGPVLRQWYLGIVETIFRCDPHRPRRAGAARRDHNRPRSGRNVAILTDPGGPVLQRHR
ncbi:MAG: hypothetical protein JWN52_3930, partial [Actinomycetia bacterium]|nr:hypothetical protein [Actinomycetes bacterium]